MTTHHKLLTAATLAASMVAFPAFNSPAQPADLMKRDEAITAQSTLSGTVTLLGEPPEEHRIDVSADPVCEQLRPYATYEAFVVKEGKLANVLLYLTSETLLLNSEYQPPSSPVVLERKQCRFEPRVLGIQTGQALEVINRDATQHNLHPVPKLNREWNLTQNPFTQLVKKFDRPELVIPVKCNQHPWEKAYISVFNHPFFAVTDAQGNYAIDNVPPGSYKVTAWHEKLGEKTMEVLVVSGASQAMDFNYYVDDPEQFK
jgi:plastocyanin